MQAGRIRSLFSGAYTSQIVPSVDSRRRDGRVAEGARLESVFTRKGNVGSNPTLSAILFKINELIEFQDPLSGSLFVSGMSDMQFCKAPVRSVKAETDRLGISFRV